MNKNKGPTETSDRPAPRASGHPDVPLRTVKEMGFGILSPEEILQMSVTPEGIQLAQVYDDDGSPLKNGLMDPRLGVADKSCRCLSCHGLVGECPGHFGHIDLAEPVYHVCFLGKVLKILRCICYYCYKLLVPPENARFKKILDKTSFPDRRRFQQVYELCKGKNTCEREKENPRDAQNSSKRTRTICGHRQPKYKLAGLEIIIEWDNLDAGDGNRKLPLLPKHARGILGNISQTECVNMGIDPEVSRPEWMVATVFVVPPISVRPMAITFNGAKNQDDLTYKLADVVNANKDLREAKENGAPWPVQYELLKALQYHTATLVDNDLPGIPVSVHKYSRKVVKSLKVRLKGKEGRIRGNLMGKRVDFSARTVISPDPCLRVDEVGIPQMIAKNLTYPEFVTDYNKEQLEKLVAKGPNVYPGAKMVIKPNGDRVDLRYNTQKLKLMPGFKVERDLVDGDLVVFNRQPSLHKMSMMGHRVKVLPHTTFRLNLSCTTPYNADFDGDEMNLHVPQSVDVKAEVENLQLSTRNIITPQSNRPVMGIVQDALTGCQKLTRRDTLLDKESFMNLLMHITNWDGKMPAPAILKPKPLWTGKQLFSLLIPGALNVMRKHSTHPDDEDDGPYRWITVGDTKVLVDQGELISGILCRNTLGTASGSLLHVCMMELGHEVTGILYNDIQNVVNSWLRINAHSIGFKDCLLEPDTSSKVEDMITKAKNQVWEINNSQGNGEDSRVKEQKINAVLNNAMNEAGRLVQSCLNDTNRLKTMVTAGSKGSLINIAQITACIGQLNVEGRRIKADHGDRTLPHFEPHDNSPESRGFVENSFCRGLEPHEYYFQCMAGREGLIDTAVKTAETGYIQRRLIKAMESVMVQYDGTVRNTQGQIVEFCYGEDGLSGEKVEFQNLPTLQLSDLIFRRNYQCELSDSAYDKIETIFTPEVANNLLLDPSLGSLLDKEFEVLGNDRKELRKIFPDGDSKVVLPCNLKRMFINVKKAHHITETSKCTVNPRDVIEKVQRLTEKLKISYRGDDIDREINQNATFLIGSLIRSMLCVKEVCERQRLSQEAFDQLLLNIQGAFEQAKVEPGEMVGAIAAQSIGEPATQMTLNTFHFAGVSSKNVTLGIPRLKEIINISKNPKSPTVTVSLRGDCAQDEIKARRVASQLKCTTLEDIVLHSSVFQDADLHESVVPGDQSLLDAHFVMPIVDMTTLSKFCIRIVLDRKKVCNEGLTMDQIATKINSELKDKAVCFHSDDNAGVLFLRIFLLQQPVNPNHEESLLSVLESNLFGLRLKGIPSILDVTTRRTSGMDGAKMKVVEDETGSLKRLPEWIIETDGSALLEIMSHPDVDPIRTRSNDIWEVYQTLGIEAARKVIEMELRSVLKTYGLYVNYRHLSILCAVMTSKGNLMPITRYGINRQGSGPLMRCSFEETADVLIDAAVHSERDDIRGVSEHVIVGQMPKMGTGACDVLLDMEKLCPGKTADLLACNELDDGQVGTSCKKIVTDGTTLYTSAYLKKFFSKLGNQLSRKEGSVVDSPWKDSKVSKLASFGCLSKEKDESEFVFGPSEDTASIATYSTSAAEAWKSPTYAPNPVSYSVLSPPYFASFKRSEAHSPSYSPVPASDQNPVSYSPGFVGYSATSPPYAPTYGGSASSYDTSTTSTSPPAFSASSSIPSYSSPLSTSVAASSFGTKGLTSPTYSPVPSSTYDIKSFTPQVHYETRKPLRLSESEGSSDSEESDRTRDSSIFDPFMFGDIPSFKKPKKKKMKIETPTLKVNSDVNVGSSSSSLLSAVETQNPSYSPFAPTFDSAGTQYKPDL